MTNHNSVQMQALKAACEARIPVMLVGPPGVGKTATIHQMAKEMGYHLITVIGSQLDPTDITGLPKAVTLDMGDGEETLEATEYLAPKWQVDILTKKTVLLFLDEFSNTSSAVRASMLTMLQNREFPNGRKMPQETIVIGAMNPTEQAADGWELDAPTTNRLMFLSWEVSTAEWFKGMLDAWGNENASKEEMFWRNRIVDFLKTEPRYVHRDNSDHSDDGTSEAYNIAANDISGKEVLKYAWASRRSWDNLSRALAHTPRDAHAVQDRIATGLVGAAATQPFRKWQEANSQIKPEEVLKNPNSVDWESMSLSDFNALMSSITKMVSATNWKQVNTILEVIGKTDRASDTGAFLNDLISGLLSVMRQSLNATEFAEGRTMIQHTIQNAGLSSKPKAKAKAKA